MRESPFSLSLAGHCFVHMCIAVTNPVFNGQSVFLGEKLHSKNLSYTF